MGRSKHGGMSWREEGEKDSGKVKRCKRESRKTRKEGEGRRNEESEKVK